MKNVPLWQLKSKPHESTGTEPLRFQAKSMPMHDSHLMQMPDQAHGQSSCNRLGRLGDLLYLWDNSLPSIPTTAASCALPSPGSWWHTGEQVAGTLLPHLLPHVLQQEGQEQASQERGTGTLTSLTQEEGRWHPGAAKSLELHMAHTALQERAAAVLCSGATPLSFRYYLLWPLRLLGIQRLFQKWDTFVHSSGLLHQTAKI